MPDGRTLTSAWIETYWHLCISEQGNVALSRVRGLKQYMFEQLAISSIGRTLTSAWIETPERLSSLTVFLVALSRVRGLKLKTCNIIDETYMSHSHECVD